MAYIKERESTHIYHVNRMSKEEMDLMVGRCIHEQPAYCAAVCPFKLDTKRLLQLAASGDFKKALAVYEKITPFPILLSSGCEAPCEGKCKLCSLGDGISIREVEKAVARFGEKGKRSSVFRMRKKKKAVIFGSGLFPLFLAGELEKKMYPTTICCRENSCLEYVCAAAPFLSEKDQKEEAARLKSMDLSFVFGFELTKENISGKAGEYDLVCASEEIAGLLYPGEEADPNIMAIEERRFITGKTDGVMLSALAAKKAAMSADRYAQNLSAYNNRTDEGIADTKLYTDVSEVVPVPRVFCGPEGYTKEEAIKEASRCIQCHCDACMKSCAYLAEYKKYPGLLGREIFNNTQIIMGDHPMNRPMNSCALCGQCTVVCPNGFDMSAICKSARENMVSTDKMPLATHEFALMDMIFSNTEAFFCRPQPGYETCRYVFFPGCQAGAIAPAVVEAAYKDLMQRLDGGVALMLGCCGAISDWAGRYEMTKEHRSFLKNELAKLGDPVIITGCPTCTGQLKEAGENTVIGIWEILEQIGIPSEAKGFEMPVAIHDACGARGDETTQKQIRKLLSSAGCETVEVKDSKDKAGCCGYGGLTAYANRDVAKKMTEKCLEKTEAPYVTYCFACRDRFAREGRTSRHLLEFLYSAEASETPDLSEKRYNRLMLVQQMRNNIWNEEAFMETKEFSVTYTEEVIEMMDQRMILKSDVEQVLQDYRETQEAILDGETGQLLARSRIGNVTFWVRFVETEGGYQVFRAYSHRMNIEKRAGQ